MYDVMIPLGEGGNKTDDIELRYSLRSLYKYLKGYLNVYIIGSKPDWIQNVIHIPFNETTNRKQFNLYSKLVEFTKHGGTKSFIYWHDDHFLLRRLSVRMIEPWCEGTLQSQIHKAHGKYKDAVINTFEAVGNRRYYDVHTPCIFSKERIKGLAYYDWSKEHVIKSLYAHHGYKEIQDCKINRPHTKTEIMQRINGRLFFSTGPNGIKGQMIQVFNELYPEKSIYER